MHNVKDQDPLLPSDTEHPFQGAVVVAVGLVGVAAAVPGVENGPLRRVEPRRLILNDRCPCPCGVP
jgi:hypothetical protein